MRHIYVLGIWISFSIVCQCQSLGKFTIYDNKDGLEAQEIYQIEVDSAGNKWIGTDNGLFFFDDYRFQKIDCSKLNDPFIIYVKKDNNNIIWVCNYNGQLAYIKNHKLNLINTAVNKKVYDFCFYDKFLITTSFEANDSIKANEIYVVDYSEEITVNEISDSSYLSQLKVRYNLGKIGNSIYFCNPDKLIKYDFDTDSHNYLQGRFVCTRHFSIHNDSIHLIDKNNGILHIDSSLTIHKTTPTKYNHHRVYKTKNFLLGVTKHKNLELLLSNEDPFDFLATDEINHIYEDPKAQRTLWFCTNNSKLVKYEYLEEIELIRNESDIDFNNIGIRVVPNKKMVFFNSDGELFELVNDQFIKRFEAPNAITDLFILEEYLIVSTSFQFFILDKNFELISENKYGYYKNSTTKNNNLYTTNNNYIEVYSLSNLLENQPPGYSKEFPPYGLLKLSLINDSVFVQANDSIYYFEADSILANYNTFESNTLSPENFLNKAIKQPKSKFFKKYFIAPEIVTQQKSFPNYQIFLVDNTLIIYNERQDSLFHIDRDFFKNAVGDFAIFEDKLYISDQISVFVIPKNKWLKNNQRKVSIDKIVYSDSIYNTDKEITLKGSDPSIEVQIKLDLDIQTKGFYYRFGTDSIKYSTNKNLTFKNLKSGTHSFEISYSHLFFDPNNTEKIEIEFQHVRSLRFYFGIVLLLAMIASVWYYIFKIKSKKEYSKNIDHLESTIRKLNLKDKKLSLSPHLIGNYLAFVSKELSQGNRKKAEDILLVFNNFLKVLYKYSTKNTVSIEDEIDFIKSYVNLESLRNPNSIRLKIEMNENIKNEITEVEIPVMLIQPIIENSIKYNRKSPHLVISMNLNLHEDLLVITVKDNGIGLKDDMEKTLSRKSSLDIIEESIAIFNGKTGGFNMKNRSNGKGVVSIINLLV